MSGVAITARTGNMVDVRFRVDPHNRLEQTKRFCPRQILKTVRICADDRIALRGGRCRDQGQDNAKSRRRGMNQ